MQRNNSLINCESNYCNLSELNLFLTYRHILWKVEFNFDRLGVGNNGSSGANWDTAVIDTRSEVTPQMTVGTWILTFVILMIPLVNIIMMFIWALIQQVRRQNFARPI